MRCETCGHHNAQDSRFCVDCGAPLARSCPRCGCRNAARARFCAECGQGLQTAPAPAAAGVPPAMPTPPLETRAAREGERKRITVLFADVVGSTSLIESLDPEHADNLLSAVMTAMRAGVARFDGTVNKLQGDGVMALFGAPIPREDHAVRACCAGLAMIDNVKAIAGAPPIRIGIHTGEVVVRAMENDISPQYDAMGVVVHIAARLEHEAGEYGVAISAATLEATRGAVDARVLREGMLRGLSEPMVVHALERIRPAVPSQQFRSGQRLSPFVGRDLETLFLERALKAARAGASRLVGIVGEAGSGKSRLLYEFLESCREEGRPVLEARATAHGGAQPLQTVLDLIRRFLGVDVEALPEHAAGRVRETLRGLGCEEHALALLDFLGLPVGPQGVLPADVAARRARLLHAIQRITRVAASQRPAILVIEDLHWLDAASEPFIETIADSIAGTHSLMLVDFRPGYHAAWMQRSYYEQLSIVPLAGDASETMLSHLLGNDASLAQIRQRLVERAAGNPFFTEELVRAVVEEHVLSGTPGNYRATALARDRLLPGSVQSVLESRIDRLGEADKLLLQSAAVVGRDFPLPVVAEIAEADIDQARLSLSRLLAAEMLYEHPDIQRDEFAFRHPLVQEAAYSSLLSDRRARLHRRAAQALETHFRDRLDERAALIAHHWEQAGEATLAATNHVKSALWVGTRDPRQALESWRKVRRLLQAQPASMQTDYMLMMACGQVVNYAWREGIDATEIEPVFNQAMALAGKLKDMRAAALITMAFGRALVTSGSADDYVARVEEAQRLAAGSAGDSVEAVLAAVYSHALSTAGLPQRALAANAAALACVERINLVDRQTLGFHPRHWLVAQRARLLMLEDRMEEAEPLIDRLLGSNDDPVDTLHQALALGVRIDAAARGRHGRAALAAWQRLAEILRDNETPYLRVLGGRYQGIALLADGQAQEAARHLEAALAHARTHRVGLEMEPYILAALAAALRHADRQRAQAIATEALELAERRAMRAAIAEVRAVGDEPVAEQAVRLGLG